MVIFPLNRSYVSVFETALWQDGYSVHDAPEEIKLIWRAVRMGEDGMVDGEWKKNAWVVGMRMVEVVVFPLSLDIKVSKNGEY